MTTPLLPFPNLTRTAQALDRRDKEVPLLWTRIDEMLDAETLTNDEFWRIHGQIEELEEAVGAAFGADTADRNNPETCRKCVRAGEPVPPKGQRESLVRQLVYKWRLTGGPA